MSPMTNAPSPARRRGRRRPHRRRRHHRDLPAAPLAGGGLLGAARRGRRRRRRHLVLEPLPRAPASTPRATPTATCSRPRAVRRVGVAGALRRAARDRALPQPRRRPVRPASAHALRLPASCRPTWDEQSRRGRSSSSATAPRCGPGSWSPPPACCRCRTSPTCPGASDFGGESHHTGRWPKDGVDLAGKRVAVVGTGVQRRAGDPGHRRRGRVAHRVPAHRQLVHAAQQLADHAPRSRRSSAPTSRRSSTCSTRRPPASSTSPTTGPRSTTREQERIGLLRADVGQPRASQAHQQLHRPAVRRGGERRVVRVHRRQDPRSIVDDPDDGRAC